METDTSDFPTRLRECSQRVGGSRVFSKKSGISEAQMFRYFRGESEPSSGKLLAMAKASDTSIDWLLTGDFYIDREDLNAELSEKILTRLVTDIEELLVEYPFSHPPSRKAKIVGLMYKELLRQHKVFGKILNFSKMGMLEAMDFLSAFNTENQMDSLDKAINFFESEDNNIINAETFTNLISRGMINWYSTLSGQLYLDRIGLHLKDVEIQFFLSQLTRMRQYLMPYHTGPLYWLDIGCGNARHLHYLHENELEIKTYGIEPSQLMFNYTQTLERSGKIPTGCVTQHDARHLPYMEEQFHIVFCRQTLFCLPHKPNNGMGAEEVVKEAMRVLKPGGILYILTYEGTGKQYAPFKQFHNAKSLKQLADSTGAKMLECQTVATFPSDNTQAENIENNSNKSIQAFMQKPQKEPEIKIAA